MGPGRVQELFFIVTVFYQTISFFYTTGYWKIVLFPQSQHSNACSVFSELLCFFLLSGTNLV